MSQYIIGRKYKKNEITETHKNYKECYCNYKGNQNQKRNNKTEKL